MFTKADCVFLGVVAKSHGYKGSFHVKIEVEFIDDIQDSSFFLIEIDNGLVPFFIQSFSISPKGKSIVKLEDVDDEEKVKRLLGKNIFLPLNKVPKKRESGLYNHEIIGFKVIDSKHGELGKVDSVIENTMQGILKIGIDNREILIPIVDEIINSIDKEKQIINVTTPDGLLDLYR